ncbi:hypothetical protein SRHO_G00195100 [Serrasalmus rhombeus]
MADSDQKINWLDALPLALMSMRMSTNRTTHLTPHEMLTGRPMPVTYLRGPTRGPNLEQLQNELQEYVKCLTKIHKEIFTQVKGATEGRTSTINDKRLKEVLPGDYVAPDLTSVGPDQQQPHIAEDSGAGDQAVAGPSGVSQGASPEQRHKMMMTLSNHGGKNLFQPYWTVHYDPCRTAFTCRVRPIIHGDPS